MCRPPVLRKLYCYTGPLNQEWSHIAKSFLNAILAFFLQFSTSHNYAIAEEARVCIRAVKGYSGTWVPAGPSETRGYESASKDSSGTPQSFKSFKVLKLGSSSVELAGTRESN